MLFLTGMLNDYMKQKNKTTTIAGKTEKSATVADTIGTKVYTTKAVAYGTYKVAIPIQNASTSISVTAKDAAGKISFKKVAPNIPTVNPRENGEGKSNS